MRKTVLTTLMLIAITALASGQIAHTPPAAGAYQWTGTAWTAMLSGATSGAINYTPPASALYCYNSGLGKWVPADSSCLGGGGGGGARARHGGYQRR